MKSWTNPKRNPGQIIEEILVKFKENPEKCSIEMEVKYWENLILVALHRNSVSGADGMQHLWGQIFFVQSDTDRRISLVTIKSVS